MTFDWREAFTRLPDIAWAEDETLLRPVSISTLENLKRFLDLVHIKYTLLRHFVELDSYPLVSPDELMPSFEATLYEYYELPGFSLVAFDRPLHYFLEPFQFDIFHCVEDAIESSSGPASPFEPAIIKQNQFTFLSRLPKTIQDRFKKEFADNRVTDINVYPRTLPYILHMDRGHVISKNNSGDFYLSGIYASFPSHLDSELKRLGLKIGKFKKDDSLLYELNRNFVYQFLMELYGFPISAERRTSAALFARQLNRKQENFLIRVLGQSDRTITTITANPENRKSPLVEKTALVAMQKIGQDKLQVLEREGFLISKSPPAVILRIFYSQHRYDPTNIRRDRALSATHQEFIHPLTGRTKNAASFIKDSTLLYLALNDIVKGEYFGRIKYKRNEIVENTDSHEKKLKFLYAWLRKHQRRIIGYSDEFYDKVAKVLDNYLFAKENYYTFQEHNELYQEVWKQYSFIRQARKVKQLEDIRQKKFKGRKINYLEMLERIVAVLKDLKFEVVVQFESLLEHALATCNETLNDSYLLRRYIKASPDDLSAYGREIQKKYKQLQDLRDDFSALQN
ncbi:MAG: hypothetical protein ACOC9D_05800 [Thermodesulfobacteriota bacterium]